MVTILNHYGVRVPRVRIGLCVVMTLTLHTNNPGKDTCSGLLHALQTFFISVYTTMHYNKSFIKFPFDSVSIG